MVWTYVGEGVYGLMMTDGYISQSAIVRWRQRKPWNRLPYERGMGEHFFRLGTAQVTIKYLEKHDPEVLERRRAPNPFHVWVLGKPNWLEENLAEPIKSIVEAEKDDSYRILIAGLEADPHDQHFGMDWNSWRRLVGMTRAKKHNDKKAFKDTSKLLLGIMNDYYDDRRRAPTKILQDLDVPFEFVGTK